ncbi:hypothetical protein DFH06DRAFT_1153312 [Mycena polygramma]|nr:hypothetical protein DFH06DRAFT_1153312 [Mycena polygramma]
MASQGLPTGRDLPPHLADPPAPQPSTDASTLNPAAALTQHTEFYSAHTSVENQPPCPEDAESYSSGERTTSPSAPTGLRVRVMTDLNGLVYMVNPETGLRFDLTYDNLPQPPPLVHVAPAYLHPNVRTMSTTPSTASALLYTVNGLLRDYNLNF